MGMIWKMVTPSPKDWQTEDEIPYNWLNYCHKMKQSYLLAMRMPIILFVRIYDPHVGISTKDDERDRRCRVNYAHMFSTLKSNDPFPTATVFKTLLCSSSYSSNKIGSYLADLQGMRMLSLYTL